MASLEHEKANEYVERVLSLQRVAKIASPFQVITGGKRHLSLPEESCVKKLKNDTEMNARDIRKAKRSLYQNNTGCYRIVHETDGKRWSISTMSKGSIDKTNRIKTYGKETDTAENRSQSKNQQGYLPNEETKTDKCGLKAKGK